MGNYFYKIIFKYQAPDCSTPTLSTSTIVAASVGTTLGVVVLVGIITFSLLNADKVFN